MEELRQGFTHREFQWRTFYRDKRLPVEELPQELPMEEPLQGLLTEEALQ